MTVILDSKKAYVEAERVKNSSYYVSAPFLVPPSGRVHLILTASREGIRHLRFEIHRTPDVLTKTKIVSDLTNIYSLYHSTPPNSSIGDPNNLEDDSLYKRTVVYLGRTPEGNYFDYVTIDKPGNYYLYGLQALNPHIKNNDQPTIIEAITEMSFQ